MHRLSLGLAILVATVGLPIEGSAAPIEIPPIALEAKEILLRHCYVCHGQDGADEGGFNSLMNRDRMVATGNIVPGEPDKSLLFQQVANGRMPKDAEPLLESERLSLRGWITSGAPDFNPPVLAREFLSQEYLYSAVQADLEQQAEEDRPWLRYFSLVHLYNSGQSDDELTSYRHGLSKLINSLSFTVKITRPQPIDKLETLLRIDLRHFDGTAETWERVLEFHPYNVEHDSPEARYCREATDTSVPVLGADWFVHAASRPPLYHELLDLPQTAAELETELEVNAAENIRQRSVARAGFNGSGVSRNNRLLERHSTAYGAYWKSYDFSKNNGSANLFSHPLGPGAGPNDFQHDGGEIIFNLPNGLQGYFLADAAGNRINEGPTNIVSDPNSPNQAVINGISCMSCHAQGMIDKRDQIREHVLKLPGAYSRADIEAVKSLYVPREKFAEFLEADRVRFRQAVEATGAPFTKSEPIFTLAKRFESELDFERVAAEAGLAPAEFSRLVKLSPELSRILGPLLSGQTVQRDVFADVFVTLMYAIPGRTPLAAMAADAFEVPAVWEGTCTEASTAEVLVPQYKMQMTILAVDGDDFSGTIKWPAFNNTITRFKGQIDNDFVTFTEEEYASEVQEVGLGAVYQARIRGDTMRGEWRMEADNLQAKGAFQLELTSSGAPPEEPETVKEGNE